MEETRINYGSLVQSLSSLLVALRFLGTCSQPVGWPAALGNQRISRVSNTVATMTLEGGFQSTYAWLARAAGKSVASMRLGCPQACGCLHCRYLQLVQRNYVSNFWL
ncbi:hypothetical protein F5144DRAFT_554429 [Chaetomium tenue]|uniref:Uncharacterized protein n=1 Tax=Chaetomium tenue TaxID=1854479 RepID=A0ACB7PL75_9PEZI|nr:hypothetical protein F5144DRAFT_554429 [Chaetomium globosum]